MWQSSLKIAHQNKSCSSQHKVGWILGYLGAFTIKGAKDYVYMYKSCTPMTLKNGYMSCKDYNLMKSLTNDQWNHFQNVFIFVNFHHNEFCAISICFICHKVYSKEWIIWCVHGVKILSVFYLMQNQTIDSKNLWMTIYWWLWGHGIIKNLTIWFILIIHDSPFLVFKHDFDH